jgi:manganese transport protein
MGEMVAPRGLSLTAGIIAAIIIVLNLKLIYDFATGA